MDKTQTINVAYDRVSLLLQFSACQCICSYDHEVSRGPLGNTTSQQALQAQ